MRRQTLWLLLPGHDRRGVSLLTIWTDDKHQSTLSNLSTNYFPQHSSLSFTLNHSAPPRQRTQALYSSQSVTQVNIPAATGDMGILANHVPAVEALRPGLLEIVEASGSKKFFGEC